MATSLRYTSRDLESMPDDGKRREIIDGDMFVSTQPDGRHQTVCYNACNILQMWSDRSGLGQATIGLGVIFGENDDVVPDVVWVSQERYNNNFDHLFHLHAPPELAVEVLSPGATNELLDREAKLKLYSRRGVDEYWILDWQERSVWVYRRSGDALEHVTTLSGEEVLTSPLLPGFSARAEDFFARVPRTVG
jgi:Uma2 family endonuclease